MTQVVSNGQPRPLLSWADLTENQREKLLLGIADGADIYLYGSKFVTFQNKVYSINDDWLTAVGVIEGWDKMLPLQPTHGLVLRAHTRDTVVVGRYFAGWRK